MWIAFRTPKSTEALLGGKRLTGSGSYCGNGVGKAERPVYGLVICSLVVLVVVKDSNNEIRGALSKLGVHVDGLRIPNLGIYAKKQGVSGSSSPPKCRTSNIPPPICDIPPFLWPEIEKNVIIPADFACPSRVELGSQLERRGAAVGAEIGVQKGLFSAAVLGRWPSVKKMYLIDIWRQQENYQDTANVDDRAQDELFKGTQKTLAPWNNVTIYLRMYSNEAATKISEGELDYCYLDARHDYCSVMEDLTVWWPKMKSGGFFSGHDFLYDDDPSVVNSGQDWGVCSNGGRHSGGPRGAVLEFAARKGLKVGMCGDATWFIYKP